MDWAEILRNAGIPEPPGREAIVLRMKWDVPLPPDWGKRQRKVKKK